eukprot:2744275-Prymnesium_polylepis.1
MHGSSTEPRTSHSISGDACATISTPRSLAVLASAAAGRTSGTAPKSSLRYECRAKDVLPGASGSIAASAFCARER